jgi:hypothetical protein
MNEIMYPDAALDLADFLPAFDMRRVPDHALEVLAALEGDYFDAVAEVAALELEDRRAAVEEILRTVAEVGAVDRREAARPRLRLIHGGL